MRFLLLFLLSLLSVRAAPVVDLLVDFEDGTAGSTISGTFLTNSTHGAVVGPWEPNPSPYTAAMIIGGNNWNFPFRFHVIANSVHYDGSGTRGLKYDHTVAIPSTKSALFSLPTPVGSWTNVAMGTFVVFNAVAPDANLYPVDWFVFEAGALNAYCVCQQWVKAGGAPTNYVQAHADTNGVTTRGPEIPIQAGRLYWVTLLRSATNGLCRLEVYDVALNLKLVGVSDSGMTPNTSTAAFKIGNNFATSGLLGSTEWDNLILDWTDYPTFLMPFDPQIVYPVQISGGAEVTGAVSFGGY